ncbi:unnamed protein product [Larinioides sclopetarius]|uniref:FAD/NAD(P)-binding domain-containing protein n=2 Tax=Larinioides sclopetarius TaxID=280406 RepID=A0AAV2B405_9ARAC
MYIVRFYSIFCNRVGIYSAYTRAGTTWGLGGTCVNVGCIPKKLYHQAASLGKAMEHAKRYGWNVNENITHDWDILRSAVIDYIKSLNWGHRVQLKQKDVDYYNVKGSFINPHEIKITHKSGKTECLSAENFVIAVGGRPKYPEIPGAIEYCISSDDIFSFEKPPGKTLVIGGSYVALECAGFLNGLGFDTTVMVRSICLRGFDQQMATLIRDHMKNEGVKFVNESVPLKIEKNEKTGLLYVTWKDTTNHKLKDSFETVLVAIGKARTYSCCN